MERILTQAVPALLVGCALLSSVGVWADGETAADQEPLAAGQMLAKFAAGGATDSEVARLLASGETVSDALDLLVGQLAEAIDVPLFARQITAGREVLLEIDRSRVLDLAARRLRDLAAVQSVQIDRVAGPQRYWRDRLLLEPAPGSDLAQAASVGNDERAVQSTQRILAAGLAQPHYALVAQVVSVQQVALRIDLQATTLNLVKALQARADVEYAQPNFIATIN